VHSLGGEKQAISRIFGLVRIRVAKCVQRLNELDTLLRFDFDPREHASVVGSVISIVEKRNVPVGSQAFEEGQQRAGALRKFESVDEFVLQKRGPATDHVAYMILRHLVLAQIHYWIALALKESGRTMARCGLRMMPPVGIEIERAPL
jgi:hypothetical protein